MPPPLSAVSLSPPPSTLAAGSQQHLKVECMNGPKQRRQTVDFFETTQITEVCGLWQMPDEVIASVYYSEEDRQRFKNDMRSNVKRMRNGRITDPEKHTERGLEHLASNDILFQLQGEKQTLVDLVIEAQERGLSNAEIAKISSRASRRAVDRAQRKARRDETEAREQ